MFSATLAEPLRLLVNGSALSVVYAFVKLVFLVSRLSECRQAP